MEYDNGNPLGFINTKHTKPRVQKMTWDAANDRKLLLLGLGREISAKEYQIIANSFIEKPTAKSIQERLAKLRSEQREKLKEMSLSEPATIIHDVSDEPPKKRRKQDEGASAPASLASLVGTNATAVTRSAAVPPNPIYTPPARLTATSTASGPASSAFTTPAPLSSTSAPAFAHSEYPQEQVDAANILMAMSRSRESWTPTPASPESTAAADTSEEKKQKGKKAKKMSAVALAAATNPSFSRDLAGLSMRVAEREERRRMEAAARAAYAAQGDDEDDEDGGEKGEGEDGDYE